MTPRGEAISTNRCRLQLVSLIQVGGFYALSTGAATATVFVIVFNQLKKSCTVAAAKFNACIVRIAPDGIQRKAIGPPGRTRDDAGRRGAQGPDSHSCELAGGSDGPGAHHFAGRLRS